MLPHFTATSPSPLPLWILGESGLAAWLRDQDGRVQEWVRGNDFKAQEGKLLLLPGETGRVSGAVLGIGAGRAVPVYAAAAFSSALPPGDYVIRDAAGLSPPRLALGWALGAYRFDRSKRAAAAPPAARLVVGDDIGEEASRLAEAVGLVRDLVNTPANDMGPAELADAARPLAAAHGARLAVVRGAELEQKFPMVHRVGEAAARKPLLVDLVWGDESHPKLTLVGKGVCFDSGGLDLKSRDAMALMKKDMGGAANVLGFAKLVMGAGLPVRLRVLVPAIENAIGGDAFRPGDVLKSRKGLSVEIGDTDAEGRLVLADALACAAEEVPDLLIDMATLTGAARSALGPDVPPFYSDDDCLAQELMTAAVAVDDPLWRMPLWPGYEPWLASRIADLNNVADSPLAGSITAALFLKRFAEGARSWIHADIHAWNTKALPGQPVGGEAQGMRALYELAKRRWPTSSSR